MNKHRLELFSDGVYAIILTLLVLDLKVPHAGGLAGLIEIAPALAVHALSFLMVGVAWRTHFRVFQVKQAITDPVVKLNLLVLFWATLIPFGARLAAEHPSGSLGATILCLGMSGAAAVFHRVLTIDQPKSFNRPRFRGWRANSADPWPWWASGCGCNRVELCLAVVRLCLVAGEQLLFTDTQPVGAAPPHGRKSAGRTGTIRRTR